MPNERDEILKKNSDFTLYSWSKQAGLNPLVIERAEGIYLFDYDGKKYIDFSSGLINMNIGHGRKEVGEAVAKQMNSFSYASPAYATKVRGEVGEKIAQLAPGDLTKTLFTLGGAEAIEHAIKLARLYSGRHKIIGRYRAYHGASYASMSAGGDPRKLNVDAQQAPGFVHVEDPFCYRCPWSQKIESCKRECVSHVERVIEFEGPQNIAAIIMEGVSGSSGCITYPPDYLKKLRALCDRHGILLIADEVMSGFGRTGKWFGIDHSEVVPDIMVMAKGMTAGYVPLGGIIVSEKIAKHFDTNTLWIGLTYSAHPVALAASSAVLAIYEQDQLVENAKSMGEYLKEKVMGLMQLHPSIGDFRGTGLLACIELVKNRKSKEPMAPFNSGPEGMVIMNKVASKLRELGLVTFVRWNYIFMAPPLNITKKEMDESLAIISETLKIADAECS